MDPLSVDGARPAVARVASLPRSWTTPAERLVLMVLASDSFDGETSAPTYDTIADWCGMHRSTAAKVLTALTKPNAKRPSLLAREETTRGGRRTLWRLLLPEPSGQSGRSDDGQEYPQPSGQNGRSNRPVIVDGSAMEPSTNRPPNRPARVDGNRPAAQDAPVAPWSPLVVNVPTYGGDARTHARTCACELPGQLTVHEVIDEIRLADPPATDPNELDLLTGRAPCPNPKHSPRYRKGGWTCPQCVEARSA